MSINGSNLLYTQWAGLIGNVNATADDRGDPFSEKLCRVWNRSGKNA